jgi:hypothetical protein
MLRLISSNNFFTNPRRLQRTFKSCEFAMTINAKYPLLSVIVFGMK